MSEAEIEQAILDAQNYAGYDGVRREAMEVLDEAQKVLARTDQGVKAAGKQLDRASKKQIKNDSNSLRKLVAKCQLGTVTEKEIADIRQAKEQLERTAEEVLKE